MLTIFHYLLNFQIIAPFLLRIALAVVLLSYCYKALRKSRISISSVWRLTNSCSKGLIITQLITATLLILGFFTQIAAGLALLSAIVKEFLLKKHGEKCTENSLLILFVAICLSLLVLGPVIFSLDLPL